MSIVDPTSIRDSINGCLQASLGSDWTGIKYVRELEKNTQTTQNRVFGTRALGGAQTEGTLKHLTVTQDFEIVLVRSKMSRQLSDSELEGLVLQNQRDMLCCYKELAATRLGVSGVLNVFGLVWAEPEFIEDGRVVVQTATVSVKYRCQI